MLTDFTEAQISFQLWESCYKNIHRLIEFIMTVAWEKVNSLNVFILIYLQHDNKIKGRESWFFLVYVNEGRPRTSAVDLRNVQEGLLERR